MLRACCLCQQVLSFHSSSCFSVPSPRCTGRRGCQVCPSSFHSLPTPCTCCQSARGQSCRVCPSVGSLAMQSTSLWCCRRWLCSCRRKGCESSCHDSDSSKHPSWSLRCLCRERWAPVGPEPSQADHVPAASLALHCTKDSGLGHGGWMCSGEPPLPPVQAGLGGDQL